MSDDSIETALTADHERLDALPFEQLRDELERHIRWEEEHLFPAVERAGGNAVARHLDSLRADHEVIREAMADGNVERLRVLLAGHNWDEEHGVYVDADRLLDAEERRELLARFRGG